MEGLIPMVFKSIKRSKTLKQYNSLSSPSNSKSGGRGLSDDNNTINIEDFYPERYNHTHPYSSTPSWEEKVEAINGSHRRYKSFNVGDHDYRVGGFTMTPDTHTNIVKSNKQLVRFRSHRLFSCVTGA